MYQHQTAAASGGADFLILPDGSDSLEDIGLESFADGGSVHVSILGVVTGTWYPDGPEGGRVTAALP
jgi:hypothetical protein